VKLADMLVHGPKSTNGIDLIGNGISMTMIRLESGRALPRLQRLDPTITVNHRSVNEDRWWGIIAEHVKVKLADTLVHGPQFTNTVDLVGLEDQRLQLDRVG
jgi:hypothetical protein